MKIQAIEFLEEKGYSPKENHLIILGRYRREKENLLIT